MPRLTDAEQIRVIARTENVSPGMLRLRLRLRRRCEFPPLRQGLTDTEELLARRARTAALTYNGSSPDSCLPCHERSLFPFSEHRYNGMRVLDWHNTPQEVIQGILVAYYRQLN